MSNKISIVKIGIIFVMILSIYFTFFAQIPFKNYANAIDFYNMKPNEKDLVIVPVNNFFSYIEQKEYQKAYDMLTDDNKKNLFDNNLNEFTNTMKKYIDSDLCKKNIKYNVLKELKNSENYNIYSFNCILYTESFDIINNKQNLNYDQFIEFCNDKSIIINVLEYSPFNYKLEINMDSEG